MPGTPQFTTYSFNDYIINFSNPNLGVQSLNGQGIGTLTITWPTENTSTDIAADGSVMMGKIKADLANVAIAIQQTSTFHLWADQLFNILNAATADQWASSKITITSLTGADLVTLNNVAFSKRRDRPYEAQPQRVTWNFVAGNAQTLGGAVSTAISTVSATILNAIP